jgi:hypothetical protein
LLLLEIPEITVLEVLRRLALYVTIGKPETSNTTKINQTENQTEEFQ